jgi:hypothetical protein
MIDYQYVNDKQKMSVNEHCLMKSNNFVTIFVHTSVYAVLTEKDSA